MEMEHMMINGKMVTVENTQHNCFKQKKTWYNSVVRV
jgi:hypothetical protein